MSSAIALVVAVLAGIVALPGPVRAAEEVWRAC